ncbi:branched-chain amino acid ABC transporter permease [Actinomadura sp. NBRC 104412]|uniref:branched-chain amino acid ABC transporter permease n=1 Tax=Actinomadura sp. NBRC 104412 TaxID=3032203 RepID=UPI0024A27EA5|nr:branched-chain amino acid ABC transporter permease [Actinomadura sp. NBRC 104412]GLZ08409.1 branched-chain amino acid ABC transporter permease [Actinomadura sp. NBRC 104412]
MAVSTLALVQTLLNGLFMGCLFGSIALGITMKWGHLGVPDFFHLSLTLLGAYLTYTLLTTQLWSPYLTLLVTMPAFFVIGVVVQYFLHVIKAQAFTSLLITFALFIVAEGAMSLIWSPDLLSMRSWLSDGLTRSIRVGSLSVSPIDLVAAVVAVITVGASALALHRTRWGRAVQAMRQDAPIAETLGVRILPIALVVSGLAAASAAAAGMVVALKMPLSPGLPLNWVGTVVVAVLLGGLGRPLGALIAAIVLGMIQNAWSLYFPPEWSPAVTFGLLFAFLALQPLARLFRERMTSGVPRESLA